MGNRREADFSDTNGELVNVRNVDGGRIQLEDGRALPSNYHEFDHGYPGHDAALKSVDDDRCLYAVVGGRGAYGDQLDPLRADGYG